MAPSHRAVPFGTSMRAAAVVAADDDEKKLARPTTVGNLINEYMYESYQVMRHVARRALQDAAVRALEG